jgi:DHA1 family bicyclomycin/chloramphenicol resistance-like MFS transporter
MPTAAPAPSLSISVRLLALLLGGLAMFGPFSIDTIFPAFPVMEHELGIGKAAMQQTISVYLLGYAAMSLVHGPLSDALGRKRVILGGIVVFIAASIGAALAGDIETLLAFRALQGLSAGVGLIVGRAVVRDALDGDAAQKLMSQVSMIFGIAPAIAPVIGGWILGLSDWRGIFWFLAAFGVVLLALTLAWLPESHPPEKRMPLNAPVLAGTYKQILGNGRFRLLALAGTFNFGALFLYIASAPAFVLDILHLGQQQFVWFFAPTIGGMILGAFTSGRAAGRISGEKLANIGFACCWAATLWNVGYHALQPNPGVVLSVLPTALLAFGIALVFPILTIAILDLFPDNRGSASSMQAFVGLLSNALIAGVLSAWLSDSALHLALGAAGFTALGFFLWRWCVAHNMRRIPDPVPEAASLEPNDEM